MQSALLPVARVETPERLRSEVARRTQQVDGAAVARPDCPPDNTAWGQTLSPQTVRAICCDAGVSRIVTAGRSEVLDVGRLTPTWSAPQRRAIAVRDRSCRGPGCGRPIAWTHIHHIRWWRNHGDTDIATGIALCPTCHDLIHHRDWTVALDPTTAAATWTSPTGREIVTHPRPPS